MARRWRVSIAAGLLAFSSLATAISNISEAIPQLEDLTPLPDTASSRPITIGGQSWTHCCLLAINASFQVNSTTKSLEFSFQPFLDPTLVSPSEFAIAAAAAAGSGGTGSFPRGATFDGKNFSGAPEVRVPYSWCAGTCDGWQVSRRSALTQWIGPLVGFILPCLAFCLNIPRRSKLSIPRWVFNPSPDKLLPVLLFPVRLGFALFMVTVDTVGWLCVCFALAGPMFLSGVYETWIDMRLLRYLWQKIVDGASTDTVLTMKLRTQLLLLVVVGNIDIAPTENQPRFAEITSITDKLVHTNARRLQDMVQVKSKLLALCSSQPSFGSAVGAPVVFFVGAFIYNMVDIQTRLGDNDTAHALAFGMWWMTIPFLAIISSLLLASNNPGSLHGILAAETKSVPTWKLFERAYDGPYEPVDLWNRGPNKMYWFQKTVEQYDVNGSNAHASDPNNNHNHANSSGYYPANGYRYPTNNAHNNYMNYPMNNMAPPNGGAVPGPARVVGREQLDVIKRKIQPELMDWCLMFSASLILLTAPFVLAFITSFNTPRVGLACRSLTHLLYYVTQILQMMLWIYWSRTVVDHDNKTETTGARFRNGACFILRALLGAAAAFIGIGGTLMQLIGVYRNCLCKIPVGYWLHRDDPGAYVLLGTNSAESITNAQVVWIRTAGAATGILGAACALAWWLQRYLRSRYKKLIEMVEVNPSW